MHEAMGYTTETNVEDTLRLCNCKGYSLMRTGCEFSLYLPLTVCSGLSLLFLYHDFADALIVEKLLVPELQLTNFINVRRTSA
jgi:hypothetical protein